jgi:hypothetical protein
MSLHCSRTGLSILQMHIWSLYTFAQTIILWRLGSLHEFLLSFQISIEFLTRNFSPYHPRSGPFAFQSHKSLSEHLIFGYTFVPCILFFWMISTLLTYDEGRENC